MYNQLIYFVDILTQAQLTAAKIPSVPVQFDFILVKIWDAAHFRMVLWELMGMVRNKRQTPVRDNGAAFDDETDSVLTVSRRNWTAIANN